VGYLTEAANTVGAQLVQAMPGVGGLNAGQMLGSPMKALLLLDVEPVLDAADAAAARAALAGSGLVVALTSFQDARVDNADVLLPISPFTETAGSFVNAEGRLQAFQGVVKPQGDARPAWKVLRVLGNLLGLPGFEHETVDEVRAEALGDTATLTRRLNNAATARPEISAASTGLERVADISIYATDALVRRATSLQLTADARAPVVGLPSALWSRLGLAPGAKVRVSQGAAAVVLAAREESTLAANAVRIAAGRAETAELGAMFGAVTIEKA
jgi:NADH-quinone oxidoreductase subunit G